MWRVHNDAPGWRRSPCCGADNERIRRFRFNLLSTYGLMKNRSEEWVMSLLRGMLAAGWVEPAREWRARAVHHARGRRGHAW